MTDPVALYSSKAQRSSDLGLGVEDREIHAGAAGFDANHQGSASHARASSASRKVSHSATGPASPFSVAIHRRPLYHTWPSTSPSMATTWIAGLSGNRRVHFSEEVRASRSAARSAYPPVLAVDDAFGVLDHLVIGGFGGVYGSSLAWQETNVSNRWRCG